MTIVWIARTFTEEHRAALDWLNEITDERFNFFGLEVELWRIGDSPVAPKFNIVSKPNDWSRTIAASAHAPDPSKLSESKALQLKFWAAFRDFAATRPSPIRVGKPQPQNWITMAIGRSGFHLSAIASLWNSDRDTYDINEVRAELVLVNSDAKQYFALLERERSEFEQALGQRLTWYSTPESRTCRIYLRRDADLRDESDWSNQHSWLLTALNDLHRVFAKRVRELDPERVSTTT